MLPSTELSSCFRVRKWNRYTELISKPGKFTQSGLTSVSGANGGFQPSGGTILQMPYFLPSGEILRM